MPFRTISLRVMHVCMAGLLTLATLFCVATDGLSAQNTGTQELLNRIDRLQREVTTLQRQFYKAKVPSAPAGQREAPTSADPMTAARHSIRITQLESELSSLTGKLEKFDFVLRRIEARLDKLVVDLDQRLMVLERRGTGIAATNEPAPRPSLNIEPQPRPPLQTAPAPAPPLERAKSGVLGTIPKNLAVTSPRGPAAVLSPPPVERPVSPPEISEVIPKEPLPALPAGTPKSQYDYALSLMLKKQDFAYAERVLKAFVKQHPQDTLTGNAQYWLGETFYVRESYQEAAFAFAEGYQNYPENLKAPDSLLKLGMSLSRMEQKKEACTAFARFLSRYPNANGRLKARVDRERRQAKCR